MIMYILLSSTTNRKKYVFCSYQFKIAQVAWDGAEFIKFQSQGCPV